MVRTAIALALSLGTFAAHSATAAEAAPSAVVLKAAHVFDGKSGRMSDNGVVVVQGDKIVSIGNASAAPVGAKVIDLGDATLLPGFIDSHVHLGMEMQKDYYKAFYQNMYRFPSEQAQYAAMYARRTLEAGFTTVRNVGDDGFADIGLRNAINSGIIPGPRMITAGHAVGSTGGHCDGGPFPPDVIKPRGPVEGVCNGPEECRAAVRYQMKWGADVIKICTSGGVLSESDPVDVPQLTLGNVRWRLTAMATWRRARPSMPAWIRSSMAASSPNRRCS